MRILVRQGDEIIRDQRYGRAPITIGSAPGCTLRLPDQRVAELQIRIFPHAGEAWLIEPIALGHRTVHNGHVLTESAYVEQGDEVDISDFSLRLYPDADDYRIETPAPRSTQTLEELAKIRSFPLPAASEIRRGDEPITLPTADQQALARLAFALHAARDIAKLLELVLSFAAKHLDARFAWMGLRRRGYGRLEFVEGWGVSGASSGEPAQLETLTYRCLERGQLLLIPRPEGTFGGDVGSLLCVPIASHRGVLGLIYVDSAAGAPAFGNAAMDVLLMVAGLAGVHMEGIIEGQLKVQEAVAAGELSFIRGVQARLDPRNVPQWDGYQLAVYCRHGQHRAGDVYDVLKLSNGMIALIVAHAEASTTRAALAITEVRTAFRVAGLHADAPHILLRELNWLLHDARDPCTLACASIVINPRNGACQYCTAGAIGAVIIDNDGQARQLGGPESPAVGVAGVQSFTSEMGRIEPGETLALFTNGCCTLQTESGQAIGRERVVSALADGFGQSASAALDGVQMELSDYLNSGRQPDDITMLLVHRERATL